MMKINLVLFGIAKDIVGASRSQLDVEDGMLINEFKQKLVMKYPKMNDLTSISFAVGTEYVEDDYQLKNNEEVVIIPPVSGG